MSDIKRILTKMSYEQYCDYLKKKYGEITEPYFTTPKCNALNNNIKRENEGLYIHHIDLYKTSLLSTPQYAAKAPFEYQMGDRLVYCNLLERLILNIKILDLKMPDPNSSGKLLGQEVIFDHIIPELNDIYSGIKYSQVFKIKSAVAITRYKEQYLACLEYLISNFIKKFDLKCYTKTYLLNSNIWSADKNKEIFNKITEIYNKCLEISEEIYY